MKSYNRIFVFPDFHMPYHHVDLVDFVLEARKLVNPVLDVFIGDIFDKHAMSFHESDPDLRSPGDELKNAIVCMQPIYKAVKKAYILHSNHDMMAFRRARWAGIPLAYMKSYGDAVQAPDGWTWLPELWVKSGRSRIWFDHGEGVMNILKKVDEQGACVVRGHWHTQCGIQYRSTKSALLWGMQVGCLVDRKSLAQAWAKKFSQRFILACGAVIDGEPMLMPMLLNRHGRWTGEIV